MLKERCSRNAYFSLNRLLGSHLARHYREFQSLEMKSPQFVRELQAERLQKLLTHASTRIPFFQQRVRREAAPALLDFPVLTKKDIRENFDDLTSAEIRRDRLAARRGRRYSWIEVKTSGSTGAPTTVIHDREFRDFNRAARLYTQSMCGFTLGKPYFKLWGSMREINDSKGSLLQRAASTLAGEVILNAFRMEEAEINSYIQIINHSSIEHMMAYSDAAHRMAEYILATGRSVRPLTSIMACAGTLTEEMRQAISRAFGSARVHNMYGSRDCGAMACECAQGAFHVFDTKVILETVDRDGRPVAAGQPGRILVTLLGNYGFPLIRYEIGDVGVFAERSCDCGLPLRVLERVEGRSVEFLLTSHGGYISPTYFLHLIGVVHNYGAVRRFQIVQYARDHAVLALEREPRAAESAVEKSIANIRRDLMAVFGAGMNLEINLVERIPESASGKFLCSINQIDRSGAS